MSTTVNKQVLRVTALAARRAMPDAERGVADAAIARTVTMMARHEDVIAAYAPMPREPGGEAMLIGLLSTGKRVLLPVLRPNLDLAWGEFTGQLGAPGPAGVRAPTAAVLPEQALAKADLVLVPALGVDRSGVRLGRGGGSYDRALTRVRPGALIVALCYDRELHDVLPTEPHDIPVDLVVTPSGVRPVPW